MKKIFLSVILLCLFIIVFGTDNLSSKKDSLLEVFSNYSEKNAPSELLNQIGQVVHKSSPDSALYFSKLAVKNAKKIEDIAQGYWNIGNCYKNIIECDSAEIYYQKAIKLFREKGLAREEYGVLNSLGFLYKRNGQFFKSITTFEQQLKLAIENKQPIWEAASYANLSIINNSLGNYDKVVELGLKAAEIYRNENDIVGVSRMCNNLGIAYVTEGKYQKGIESYKKALAINLENGFRNGEMLNYMNLAVVYQKLDSLKLANEYQLKSLEIAKERGDEIRVAIIYYNIGELYIEMNRYQQVPGYMNKSLTLFSENGDTKGVSLAYRGLAYYYLKVKEYSKSIDYASKSLKIALDISAKDYLIPTYKILSGAYAGLSDYKNAYDYQLKYKEISDSVFNENKLKTIEEMEARFQVRQTMQQLELSQKDIENKTLLIKRKNTQVVFIIIVAILTTLFSIVLLVYVVQIKRKNKLLVNKHVEVINAEKQGAELPDKNLDDKDGAEIGGNDVVTVPQFTKNETRVLKKDELFPKLKCIVIDTKGYLDKDLTLEKLSRQLETNRTYVSQLINDKYNLTFNNFINRLRVKKACEMLIDPDFEDLTIEGIAFEVGFNSKSAFNSAFKRFTGLTPSFYIKEARMKKTVDITK